MNTTKHIAPIKRFALPLTALLSLSLVATALVGLFAPPASPTSIGDWVAGPALSEARDGASAVLLADGRVLVCGGEGTAGISATAEALDASGAFTGVAPMQVDRRDHAGVLLADGRVLVVGGTTTGGSATATAEIYDPTSDSWSLAGSLAQARSGASVPSSK